MPDKKEFPSRSQRKQLMKQLKEQYKDPALASNFSFKLYIEAMGKLDEEMDRLSAPKENGFPGKLTKEQAENLSELMLDAARNGEMYIASTMKDGKVGQGTPQVVDQLQQLMAKDYEALAAYDEKEPQTLPELQESTRTLTIDLRGRKLGSVGNLQNSRIPMTVVDSAGNKRRGFFTKATHMKAKEEYEELLNKAKEACTTEEQRAELDKFLPGFRDSLNGEKTFSGKRIDSNTSDTYILGRLAYEMGDEMFVGVNKLNLDHTKTVLRRGGVDVDKVPKAALKVMQQGLTKIKNNIGLDINAERLEIPDGARIDNRNVAMSAVAGLLGCSKLVARSDNMRFIGEDGKVTEGTFMDYAQGTDLAKKAQLFQHVAINPFQNKENRKKLFKEIADVQVLDYLCMNVDRHQGNLTYDIDENGQIRGIQCFDNDSSFGLRKKSKLDVKKLKVISDSMAQRIENLTPQELKFALRGRGLSEEEMNAAGERLTTLQSCIRTKQIQRVKDEDLGEKQLQDMLPEKDTTNLFSSIHEFFTNTAQAHRDPNKPFTPLPKQPQPKLREIGVTDRKFTVGGLADSLSRVAEKVEDQITGEKIDDLRTRLRGSSAKYDAMVQAAKEANELYKELKEGKTEEELRKLVSEDPETMAKVTQAFLKVRDTTDDYLGYKTKQRKASSPETIQAKNDYERAHIDLALELGKAATSFLEQSRTRPENQAEADALQAIQARQAPEPQREGPKPEGPLIV